VAHGWTIRQLTAHIEHVLGFPGASHATLRAFLQGSKISARIMGVLALYVTKRQDEAART
jgi:hypothetical protein